MLLSCKLVRSAGLQPGAMASNPLATSHLVAWCRFQLVRTTYSRWPPNFGDGLGLPSDGLQPTFVVPPAYSGKICYLGRRVATATESVRMSISV